jgi:hypothetical protein
MGIHTSFLSAVRCPQHGDHCWYGIIILRQGVLDSHSINISHSDTEYVTGLAHVRPDADSSFLRYYISANQVHGNALGFVAFNFGGRHEYGALINDSARTGLVFAHNANTTLRNYFFIGNNAPITYAPSGTGKLLFLDCVFSGPEANLGNGFQSASNCQWNMASATPIRMSGLKTAFCEGNWDPRVED